jgi:predicted N-acetyltransferase YhbS
MNAEEFGDGARIVLVKHSDGVSEAQLNLNGQPVSRVVIIPMLIRVGAAVLRMDGIGGVSTSEGYRNRGYSRRVMEFAVAHIRAGDASLSTLFGIEDFYQKFGYETVGPEYTVAMSFADASAATLVLPPAWTFRSLEPADLPALMRLYHANTRRSTGALVRHDAGGDPAETIRLSGVNPDARAIGLRAWNKLQKIASEPGKDACRVLLDASGEIAAYAWLGAGWYMEYRRRDMTHACHVAEAMARDPIAADALLAACRLWAHEIDNTFDRVAFAMPPEGPLAAAATYEGGQISFTYTRGGNFMGRVLDTGRLLQQLLPELTARVQATSPRFRGQLTFVTDEGEALLFISPDSVSTEGRAAGQQLTVELPQTALARLCLGGYDPADLLARLPSTPDPEAVSLLQTLFPRRAPHIYPMDRF